jgi:hypothetical protein
MKFHYLVSFRLPDAQIAESHAGQLGRALRHVLAGACSDVGNNWPVVPGPVDPGSRFEWTVETVAAGAVVAVLRRSESESGSSLRRLSRWLQWTPLDVAFAMGICFAGGFLFSVSLGHWIR